MKIGIILAIFGIVSVFCLAMFVSAMPQDKNGDSWFVNGKSAIPGALSELALNGKQNLMFSDKVEEDTCAFSDGKHYCENYVLINECSADVGSSGICKSAN